MSIGELILKIRNATDAEEKQYSMPIRSSGMRYPPSQLPPTRTNSIPQSSGRNFFSRARSSDRFALCRHTSGARKECGTSDGFSCIFHERQRSSRLYLG